MVDGITRLAVHAGAPRKFHYTATVAWLRLVSAAVTRDSSAIAFGEWIKGFPELTDKGLLSLHYSRERFDSEEA